jgi:purine-binding chemotaxis protein CheW
MNSIRNDSREKGKFDWDAMRRRVSDAGQALDGMEEMPQDALEEIWAQRAAKLAQVPDSEEDGERMDLVLIQLGREIYGLDARYVWEIKPMDQITPVPRVPRWVTGVVNRRGRIFSVINLQRFFDLPAVEREQPPQLLVVETPEMELALQADQVLSIESVPVSHIEDAPSTVRSLPPEFVLGITRYVNASDSSQSLVVVLDLLALLADERLVVHEEVL